MAVASRIPTGFAFSGAAHLAFIAFAIFGAPFDAIEDPDAIQATDVEILSEAEFAALAATPEPQDDAPAVPVFEPEAISPPSFNAAVGDVPDRELEVTESEADLVEDPSEQDREADLSAVTTRVEDPDLVLETDQIDEAATDVALSSPTISAPSAPSIPRPAAPARPGGLGGPSRPSVPGLPSIGGADTPAPPRPPERPAEETPPEEAPAVEEEPPGVPGAKIATSSRPSRRPRDFEQQVAAREAEAQQIAEAAAAAEAERLAAAAETPDPAPATPADPDVAELEAEIRAAGQETSEASSLPQGPPMTQQEKASLSFAIEQCWSPPAGALNENELTITVALELDATGRIVGGMRMIEPASPTPQHQSAFVNARYALTACQPYSDLPAEKFAQWRLLEVVFKPDGSVASY